VERMMRVKITPLMIWRRCVVKVIRAMDGKEHSPLQTRALCLRCYHVVVAGGGAETRDIIRRRW
jgi:hypothetical protein